MLESVKRTAEVRSSRKVQPSVSRTSIYYAAIPSTKVLGYFQSSATPTKSMTSSAEPSQQNAVSQPRSSTSDSSPDVTVVIAALDEQENLELLLPLLATEMKQLELGVEVIVVDGGSHDDTQSVAKKLGARVVEQTERGYGGALIAGFAAANAPFVITMDADLSHPPEFLKDFWAHRQDSDLIVASRYVAGGQADMGPGRRVLSTILNRTYAVLLGLKLRDLSSGFRMYDRRALSTLDLRARDFDILEEILVKIFVRGGRIREVPFHYKVRNAGKSHAKLIKFGWAYSKTLLRMCRLRYGK